MNAQVVARLTTTILLLIGVGPSAAGDVASALEAFRRGDYATALREWTPLADAGDPSAQFHLGSAYLTGRGVPRDEARAIYWHEKAAEQGLAEAQYSLALAYYLGVGTARNSTEAATWYRRAAEQGHQQSQLRLGVLLSKDATDTATYKEAIRWLRMAADRGEASAQWRLGWIFSRGVSGKKDYAKAIPLLRDAAQQGSSKARYELGLIYENGLLYRDPFEARKWYKTAALTGFRPAEKRLAFDPRLRAQHLGQARIFDWPGTDPARCCAATSTRPLPAAM